MDEYGQNGGLQIIAGFIGATGDTEAARKAKVLREEAYIYRHNFYK
jgi:hypothetical protein